MTSNPLHHFFPSHSPPQLTHAVQVRVDHSDYELLFLAHPWRGGVSTIASILFSKFCHELRLRNLQPTVTDANTHIIFSALNRLNFSPEGPGVAQHNGETDRDTSDVGRRASSASDVPANQPPEPTDSSCAEKAYGESNQGDSETDRA